VSHDYDNRAAVPDWEEHFGRWRDAGASVRADAAAVLDVPYGRHPRCRFDLFPAERRRGPVMVFVHGGYWQWNAKEEFAFIAPAWREAGIDVVLLGYPLVPDVRLARIPGEVRLGLARVAELCRDRFAGRWRLVVAGWSAGAHLALSAADAACVDRVVCLSGIYDLVPLVPTPLNDALGLDAGEALRLSPIGRRTAPEVPCLIGVGADERPALRGQAAAVAARFAELGRPPVFREWTGLNHYSVLDAFANVESETFRDVLRYIG
jgi:acetyl esterase/lipase